jgi:hypothetical protein
MKLLMTMVSAALFAPALFDPALFAGVLPAAPLAVAELVPAAALLALAETVAEPELPPQAVSRRIPVRLAIASHLLVKPNATDI